MLLVHVSQLLLQVLHCFCGGGRGVLGLFKNVFPFVFSFLSQPLIMSDVNSVILLEIDNDV